MGLCSSSSSYWYQYTYTTFVHSYVLVLGSWVYVYRTSVHVRTCTGTCTCTAVRTGQSVRIYAIVQTGCQASFGEVRVWVRHMVSSAWSPGFETRHGTSLHFLRSSVARAAATCQIRGLCRRVQGFQIPNTIKHSAPRDASPQVHIGRACAQARVHVSTNLGGM